MEDFQNLTGFIDLIDIIDEKIAERSSVLGIGSALLFMVFSISLLSTSRMGMATSFAFASFLTFVISFFLLYIGLINMGVFVFTSLLVFGSAVYLIYKKREVRG